MQNYSSALQPLFAPSVSLSARSFSTPSCHLLCVSLISSLGFLAILSCGIQSFLKKWSNCCKSLQKFDPFPVDTWDPTALAECELVGGGTRDRRQGSPGSLLPFPSPPHGSLLQVSYFKSLAVRVEEESGGPCGYRNSVWFLCKWGHLSPVSLFF